MRAARGDSEKIHPQPAHWRRWVPQSCKLLMLHGQLILGPARLTGPRSTAVKAAYLPYVSIWEGSMSFEARRWSVLILCSLGPHHGALPDQRPHARTATPALAPPGTCAQTSGSTYARRCSYRREAL